MQHQTINGPYLQDILNSIQKIELFVSGISFEEFCDNSMMQDAVVHNIENIGETMKKLSPEFLAAHEDLPFNQAVGMRNRIVHEYKYVDFDIVWDVIQKDLPDLKARILKIIKILWKPANLRTISKK